MSAVLPELLASDRVNLAGEQTGREHLSQSSLTTFLNCAQRYDFHYGQRLSLVSKPKALSLGAAFHAGVEHRDPERGTRMLVDERTVSNQGESDQLDIDCATVVAAVELYLSVYPDPTATREYEFLVRLRSPWTGAFSRTFDLYGFADGLIEHDGHHELVELKFTSQISNLSVRRLPLDRQVALECYGVWRATGMPVRQVAYRFIRKPSIRPKRDEHTMDFIARLREDYQQRPEFYLHEERLFRSDEDLVRIEAELWTWAEQMRHARRERLWPRNTSHCHDYGGCPFIPLCVGDPDAPALYQEREKR